MIKQTTGKLSRKFDSFLNFLQKMQLPKLMNKMTLAMNNYVLYAFDIRHQMELIASRRVKVNFKLSQVFVATKQLN